MADMDAVVMLSLDLQFAFVERTERAASAKLALDTLASRADSVFAGYQLDSFDAGIARVVGLEHWDTGAGVRHPRPAAATQPLWRIDIGALALTHPGVGARSAFVDALEPLRDGGQVDDETWGRMRLLQGRVDELDEDLRRRQDARPADAPRAYATPEHARALVRLVQLVTETLTARERAGGSQTALGRDLAAHSAEVRERLTAEEDRDVAALRSELDRL